MIRLKELRNKKRLTMIELSEKSGVSVSYISEIERRKHQVSVEILCKLCKALNVTPNDLIDKKYWA